MIAEALTCADTALYRSKQTNQVEICNMVPTQQAIPLPRPALRTRNLDTTPVPLSLQLGGAR